MADVAVSCADVWKSYRVYHQRSHTLKEKVLSRRNMYEEFWALKDVNLEVAVGSTVGVVGANGSGKSTLLKTMAGILFPNKGRVTVNGSVSPLLELGTGFHPELTGRENVALAGSLLGHSRRDMERKYDSIVEFAGIENFMDIPVKNYSTGMYTRLAFAVAISVDPEILLIDEVLSVGDESFQLRCHERIAELRADGRTVVLVSHSLDTVRALCKRAVWIEKGEVRKVGLSHEVVAAYLGGVHQQVADNRPRQPRPENRYGTGAAEITSVSFLDSDGDESPSFCTGQPFTVRVAYAATEPIDDATCGIAVFRADSHAYVFGQSTHGARIKLRLSEAGTIDMTVPALPVLKGQYLVTVSLERAEVKEVFDLHDREYSFVVIDNPALPTGDGLFHVPTTWTLSQSTVPA
ncbi:MAG TPA: ABC transporter ATP-binding protein [Acidimicrobiales bacterium]|jgi:ABC-type polysaccharide/polyol phosphate transport system ATPase subunit|nr:ABC transporter ATP-binding protein [Acidimicrobiales bacterium]